MSDVWGSPVHALATRTVRFRLFPSLPPPSAVPTNTRQADYYYLLANDCQYTRYIVSHYYGPRVPRQGRAPHA